jgi:hypothetical protein
MLLLCLVPTSVEAKFHISQEYQEVNEQLYAHVNLPKEKKSAQHALASQLDAI